MDGNIKDLSLVPRICVPTLCSSNVQRKGIQTADPTRPARSHALAFWTKIVLWPRRGHRRGVLRGSRNAFFISLRRAQCVQLLRASFFVCQA